MENPRKRTVLLAEHIAENHTDLYAAFKNTFEVKLVSSSNTTFYADCVLNNIPFLFLLGKCNNFKTRIRSFVQKFKPSRYVILFSDNWSMYKEAVLCGNDKAASAEKISLFQCICGKDSYGYCKLNNNIFERKIE